jgi:hypothetical protein
MIMKKVYMKPSMKVVPLQHQTNLLAGSNGANSLNSNDGFTMPKGGNLNDDDYDM